VHLSLLIVGVLANLVSTALFWLGLKPDRLSLDDLTAWNQARPGTVPSHE
jgi:hypothetical protein